MSDREPSRAAPYVGMSDRDPSPAAPYVAMVNMSRTAQQPDDWQAAVIQPAGRSARAAPGFGRGLLFAIPISACLWAALYGLWRLLA